MQVARRGRRRRAAFALSVGCLAFTIPGLASANTGLLEAPQIPDTVDETLQKGPTASPPPLDTVQETIDSVLDPVEDATKPVKDAVKPVTDPVDEAVGPVTDTIDEGTTPITDVIDDPIQPVTDGDGAGSPTTTDPPESTLNGGTGRALAPVPGGDVSGRPRDRGTVVGTAARPPAPAPVAIDARLRPAPSAARADAATDRVAASGGSATDQIARAVVDASRAFRFPLLVAAAVLLFLAIQGRIDGRDPKLANSQDDEELMFA